MRQDARRLVERRLHRRAFQKGRPQRAQPRTVARPQRFLRLELVRDQARAVGSRQRRHRQRLGGRVLTRAQRRLDRGGLILGGRGPQRRGRRHRLLRPPQRRQRTHLGPPQPARAPRAERTAAACQPLPRRGQRLVRAPALVQRLGQRDHARYRHRGAGEIQRGERLQPRDRRRAPAGHAARLRIQPDDRHRIFIHAVDHRDRRGGFRCLGVTAQQHIGTHRAQPCGQIVGRRRIGRQPVARECVHRPPRLRPHLGLQLWPQRGMAAHDRHFEQRFGGGDAWQQLRRLRHLAALHQRLDRAFGHVPAQRGQIGRLPVGPRQRHRNPVPQRQPVILRQRLRHRAPQPAGDPAQARRRLFGQHGQLLARRCHVPGLGGDHHAEPAHDRVGRIGRGQFLLHRRQFAAAPGRGQAVHAQQLRPVPGRPGRQPRHQRIEPGERTGAIALLPQRIGLRDDRGIGRRSRGGGHRRHRGHRQQDHRQQDHRHPAVSPHDARRSSLPPPGRSPRASAGR